MAIRRSHYSAGRRFESCTPPLTRAQAQRGARRRSGRLDAPKLLARHLVQRYSFVPGCGEAWTAADPLRWVTAPCIKSGTNPFAGWCGRRKCDSLCTEFRPASAPRLVATARAARLSEGTIPECCATRCAMCAVRRAPSPKRRAAGASRRHLPDKLDLALWAGALKSALYDGP